MSGFATGLRPFSRGTPAGASPADTYLITFAAADTAVTNAAASGSIVNTGTGSVAWSITPPSNVTVTPSSGLAIAGTTTSLSIVATAAATYSLSVTAAGATITGNSQSIVVSSSAPTTATLSGGTTATSTEAETYTVTLNAAADQTYTITPSASDSGSLSAASFTITAGNTSGSVDVTWPVAGAGRTVDFTISPSLTRSGRPLTVAVVDPAASTGVLPSTTTLTPAVTGTVPFSIGQPFVQGAIAAGDELSGLQLNVMTTWPDGSAKFGIVSGTASMTSGSPYSMAMSIGTAAAGTPIATSSLSAVTAVIDAGAFGDASFGATEWASPFQTVATGPVMSSWVYRKQIGSDAHLVAWLEVRAWTDGSVEVLPWIENGYLNVASPTHKTATYTFTLGGISLFSASITLTPHSRTPLLSGTALSHWLGDDHEIDVQHDQAYLQLTELVPTYLGAVDAGATAVTTCSVSTFTPLAAGGFIYSSDDMSQSGFQWPIGLLPTHDALYLTTPGQYASVVRNGYCAGRYPIHYRDEATNQPPRPSDWPNLVIRSSTGFKDSGTSSTGAYTPAHAGGTTSAPLWDPAHAPSVGYLAYLLTGRAYFRDEVVMSAAANALWNYDDQRGGADGLIFPIPGAVQVRACAWILRTLAQAVTVLPSSDTTGLRADFIASMESNAASYHTQYVATSNNPFGFIQPDVDYNDTTGNASITASSVGNTLTVSALSRGTLFVGSVVTITTGETRTITAFGTATGQTGTYTFGGAAITQASSTMSATYPFWRAAPWQQDFFTATMGYARSLDLPLSATPKANLEAFFDWTAESIVGRLGASSDYWWVNGGLYTMAVATTRSANWTTGAGPWHASWAALYADTVAQYANVTGGLSTTEGTMGGNGDPSEVPAANSMAGNLMPALAYAVRHGVTGARDAFRRFTTATNWQELETLFAANPVWAVVPKRPAWLIGQPVGKLFAITGTTFQGSAADQTGGVANSRFAYSNGAVVGSEIIFPAPGGHGDYAGNEVTGIEMWAEAPSHVLRKAKTTSVSSDLPHNASDGTRTSAHLYNLVHWSAPTQRLVLHRHKGMYPTGGSTANSDGFDVVANAWDAASTFADGSAFATCNDGAGNVWGYSADQRALWKYVGGTDTWSQTFSTGGAATVTPAAAWDTARAQLFQIAKGDGEFNGSGVTAWKYNTAGTAQTSITLTDTDGSLANFSANGGGYDSLIYDPDGDRFILYDAVSPYVTTPKLYQITPNGTTTWDMAYLPNSGATVPAAAGSFSRALHIPLLRCVVLWPDASSTLYAYRLA